MFTDVSLEQLVKERVLEVTIWDFNQQSSNDFLGGVRLGSLAPRNSSRRKEWMDCTGGEVHLVQQHWGVLVAYWLKCWPAIGRLHVQAPLDVGFFAREYTQLHPQNEEVFVTASFGGYVKLLVPGSWLILATCAIPASSLATFGKNTCTKKSIK